ncbi:MAG: T9SS type A sorting domain-containing protein, partial [Bacteroidetes bacterium]|nr:T9SS type A sorting domain-containing protein [Bacteroidota bacterium]
GSAPVTATITITPTNTNAGLTCTGTSQVFTITVNPTPDVNAVASQVLCNGDLSTAVTFTGAVAGVTYYWTNDNPSIGLAINGTNSIAAFTAVNNGNVPSVGTITVTPQTGPTPTCTGLSKTFTITVNPAPVGIPATPTVCSDVAVGPAATITTTSGSAPAASFTIATNPNGLTQSAGTVSAGTGKGPAELTDDAWTNTTGGPVNVVYTITPISASGCVGAPFTITVTVNPEPATTAPVTTSGVCSDVAIGYNFTVAGAATYNITTNSNGLSQSGGTVSAGTGKLSGELADDSWNNITLGTVNVVYTVTPVSTLGCLGDVFAVTVPIKPEPRGWNDTRTICGNTVVGYDLQNSNVNITGSGGNAMVSTFSWVAIDNPSVTGESLTPQSGSVINDLLLNVSSVTQNVVYQVTPTGSVSGCTGDVFTLTVTVKSTPVGVNQTVTTCSNVSSNYNLINNVAILGNNVGSTYSWVAAPNGLVGGESTTPQSGSFINDILVNVTNVPQTVLYTVTPTGVNGCVGATFQITINVNPEPVGVTATAPDICSGSPVNYNLQTNVNTLGNNLPSTFIWVAADNPSISGESTFAQTTSSISDVLVNTSFVPQVVTYTVNVTGTNGCAGAVFTITVTVNPKAQITAGPDLALCEDTPSITLQGGITYAPNGVNWTGGAGSFSNAASATSDYFFSNPAEINTLIALTLTANDPDGAGPCASVTDQMQLKINKLPTVVFTGLPSGAPPQMAENQLPIVLTGNQVGGIFTISPVTSVIGSTYVSVVDRVNFDPSAATLGPNYIRYTFTDANSCTNFNEQEVVINPVTIIDFAIQGATVNASNEFELCAELGLVKLNGFPAASTGFPPETQFTASTGFYNAANTMTIVKIGPEYYIQTTGLKSDNYTITYTYKNALNAVTFKSRNVKIFASPVAGISVANSCIASAINFTDTSTVPSTPFPTTTAFWKWDFNDGSFSNLQNPSHVYSFSGIYTIAMDVTTAQGCRSTATKSIRVGDVPTVGYDWSAICNNDSTKFVDQTNPGTVSVIQTYTWDFGDGDILTGAAGSSVPLGTNGGRTSGTFKNPSHKYVAFGTYTSKLTVDTNDGCNNSLQKQVFILPYSTVTPLASSAYVETFEASAGGWIAETKTAGSGISWIWTTPSGATINSAAGGAKAWWTGANTNTYYNSENSFVNGPCFNLTNLKRPMISFDYWCDSQLGFDGAVLQYSVNGGTSWANVGVPREGINWYDPNNPVISNPGGQVGAFGWSGKTGKWITGKFNLDTIPLASRSQVRIRFAFASNADNPSGTNFDGFAFDNVYVGNKQRNVLVEHFTNSNLQASVDGDTWINNLYANQIATRQGETDFNHLQYHINYPTADALNKDNPTDPAARALLFGVSQPPSTIMDGIVDGVKFKGKYTDINKVEIDRRALVDPAFDLQLTTIPTGVNNEVTVVLTMTARQDMPGPLVAQVTLMENQTGTFKNVVRKQLMGPDGLTITIPLKKGDVLVKQQNNVKIDVPITNPSQLTLVGFVQDKNTKEIYQSAVIPAPTLQGAVVVGLEPQVLAPTTLNGIAMYPNPANGSFYLSVPDGNPVEGYTWRLIDQRGITVLSGDFNDMVNNERQIPVSELANGIYFVELTGPGQSVVHRKLVVMNRN